MRKMGSLLTCAAVLFASAAGVSIAAKPTIEYMRIVPLEPLRAMKDTLKLTDEQVGRYRSLRDVYIGKVKDAATQQGTKQKEMVTLLKVEKPDMAAIEAKVKEIMAVEQTQIMAAAQFYADFSTNLTKDQQTVFWAEAGKMFLKDEPAAKEPAKTEAPAAPAAAEPKKEEPKKEEPKKEEPKKDD